MTARATAAARSAPREAEPRTPLRPVPSVRHPRAPSPSLWGRARRRLSPVSVAVVLVAASLVLSLIHI